MSPHTASLTVPTLSSSLKLGINKPMLQNQKMEMTYGARILVLSLLFIFFMNSLAKVTFNVVKEGARPDGKTDSTSAFENAWRAACGSSEPATIYVPQGTFLLHQIQFNGPCKSGDILLQIEGSIVAPYDYNVLANAYSWIQFQGVNGLSIEGGLLDGKGTGLWKCKEASSNSCPIGARTLEFHKSSNISIIGLTSRDSQLFHIVIDDSQNINLQGVTVLAPGKSPNTDGIHVQQSTGVTIIGSNMSTGDDCISIGPGTRDLWIENINCGPGHGISIGSLGWRLEEDGVRNVTVKSVSFTNTQNGVRIKTWGRLSNSFVRGVVFQNATMDNVKSPIVIDQNYCPRHQGCPGQASGVKIKNVEYLDIHGTSATEVAVKFDCSATNPCTDIRLEDINLTYKNQPAKAWCANASGKSSGEVNPRSCFQE